MPKVKYTDTIQQQVNQYLQERDDDEVPERIKGYLRVLQQRNNSHSYTCCFCEEDCKGFGNNAQPLKDSICCDSCNLERVVPARLKSKLKEADALSPPRPSRELICPGAPRKPVYIKRSCTRYGCSCPRNDKDEVDCEFYPAPSTSEPVYIYKKQMDEQRPQDQERPQEPRGKVLEITIELKDE
jgi:hypothetical protein